MSHLTIQLADSLQRRTAGPLTATHIFQKSREALVATPLTLTRHTDDIQPYDASYLVMEGVLLAIRRYASQPENQFTVWVDEAGARQEGFHPMQMASALLEHLHVGTDELVWVNDEMSEAP